MQQDARIDLNSDVGESFGAWTLGDDEAIVPLVSSANVACGFHAGDPLTIRRTCAAAARAGVSVGAHVGVPRPRRLRPPLPRRRAGRADHRRRLPDRRARRRSPATAGTTVRYVKPHGALYNAIVDHREQARAVVAAVVAVDPALPLLTLPGAVVGEEARAAGLRVVTEAFVDRAYTRAGHPRARAASRVPSCTTSTPSRRVPSGWPSSGRVETIDGAVVDVDAESLCVHGDTPGAVAMAAAVRAALAAAGVRVAAFA